MLVAVRLGGEDVTLCGSHALMHRRAREQAKSIEELRAAVSNRRTRSERRGVEDRTLGEIDELGLELSAAFSGERRRNSERRSA